MAIFTALLLISCDGGTGDWDYYADEFEKALDAELAGEDHTLDHLEIEEYTLAAQIRGEHAMLVFAVKV